MAEDIRRTGDWDWIVGELERAIRDEDRNVTDLLLEAALMEFRIFRGEAGRPTSWTRSPASSATSTTSTSPWPSTGSARDLLLLHGEFRKAAGDGSSSRTAAT